MRACAFGGAFLAFFAGVQFVCASEAASWYASEYGAHWRLVRIIGSNDEKTLAIVSRTKRENLKGSGNRSGESEYFLRDLEKQRLIKIGEAANTRHDIVGNFPGSREVARGSYKKDGDQVFAVRSALWGEDGTKEGWSVLAYDSERGVVERRDSYAKKEGSNRDNSIALLLPEGLLVPYKSGSNVEIRQLDRADDAGKVRKISAELSDGKFLGIYDIGRSGSEVYLIGALKRDGKVRMGAAVFDWKNASFERTLVFSGHIGPGRRLANAFVVPSSESAGGGIHVVAQKVMGIDPVEGEVVLLHLGKGSRRLWGVKFGGQDDFGRLRWLGAGVICRGNVVIGIPQWKEGAMEGSRLEGVELLRVGKNGGRYRKRVVDFTVRTFGPTYIVPGQGRIFVGRHFSRYKRPSGGGRWESWDGYVIGEFGGYACDD